MIFQMKSFYIIRKNTTISVIEIFDNTPVVVDTQNISVERHIRRCYPICDSIIGICCTNERNIPVIHIRFC